MFARNCFSLIALLGILVFIVGCGQKLPADMPKLCPTQIEVTTTDGSKLERASVGLHPMGASTEASGGTTNAKGIAEIFTRGQFSGVPAGKYKVTVTWVVNIADPTSQPKIVGGLEAEYANSGSTPLEVEVVEGKNKFSVEVKKLDPLPTR
jgi:hypothetical protein